MHEFQEVFRLGWVWLFTSSYTIHKVCSKCLQSWLDGKRWQKSINQPYDHCSSVAPSPPAVKWLLYFFTTAFQIAHLHRPNTGPKYYLVDIIILILRCPSTLCFALSYPSKQWVISCKEPLQGLGYCLAYSCAQNCSCCPSPVNWVRHCAFSEPQKRVSPLETCSHNTGIIIQTAQVSNPIYWGSAL